MNCYRCQKSNAIIPNQYSQHHCDGCDLYYNTKGYVFYLDRYMIECSLAKSISWIYKKIGAHSGIVIAEVNSILPLDITSERIDKLLLLR